MTTPYNLQTQLGLQRSPVAVGFFDSPPADVPPWNGPPVAAGCVFWKEAQEGKTFCTAAADHYNCAVGAHTHHIALPPERGVELEQTVQFMVSNDYIALAEVPSIPTLSKTPAFIAYAPAETAPFLPDVVVVAARPGQAMLIYEAAIQIGVGNAVMDLLGRPGCAVLPMALNGGGAALSLGCKGNRTFTGLPDEEMYLAIPGQHWEAVCGHLASVQTANANMETYYNGRKLAFSAPLEPR